MNHSKTDSRQRGFTLVEVIVVAVIVAAMAAVAVPLYLGYVESSRKNAAANTAGSVASFCGACRNSGGTVTPTLNAAPAGGGSMTCTVGGTSIQIPADVTVVHTAPVPPAAGIVTGKHINSTGAGVDATFNY